MDETVGGYIEGMRARHPRLSMRQMSIDAGLSPSVIGQVISGKLIVTAGSRDWTFEFRSNEKAHAAYQLMMRNLLQTEARGL